MEIREGLATEKRRSPSVKEPESGLLGTRKGRDALGKTRNFPARQILVNYALAGGLHRRGFSGTERVLRLLRIARGDRFFN